jgi:hypothetical protein
MKIVIVLCLLTLSFTTALPVNNENVRPEVIRQDVVINGDKGYKFE